MPTAASEIQRMLGDIRQAVGRLEGQTATFIKQMEVQDERNTKLEGKVSKLEKWQGFYSGVGTVIGVILGAVGVHFKSG
jgi:hypothetical protein